MTTPVIDPNDPKVTTEPSNGIAGLVSMLVTLLGMVQAAHPNPLVARALAELGWLGNALPLIIAILGSMYTAASSAVPEIRNRIPWKKTRVTVIQSGGGL